VIIRTVNTLLKKIIRVFICSVELISECINLDLLDKKFTPHIYYDMPSFLPSIVIAKSLNNNASEKEGNEEISINEKKR